MKMRRGEAHFEFLIIATLIALVALAAMAATGIASRNKMETIDASVNPLGVSLFNPLGSGRFAELDTAALNKEQYVDRTYTITAISPALVGGTMIMTPNDDKWETSSSYLTFTLAKTTTAYVVFDRRATSRPTWLNATWTLTGLSVSTTDFPASPLRVYQKTLAPGRHTLGGNHNGGDNNARSNYFVILRPQ